MPATSDIHISPRDDRWVLTRAGQDQRLSLHETQAEAIEAGRDQARQDQVELVIHGEDGQIRQKDSYGHAPRNIPG